MGCCEHKEKEHSTEGTESTGGGKKMNTKIILWAVIAVLIIAVLYVTFGSAVTGPAVNSFSQVATGGMVGGC